MTPVGETSKANAINLAKDALKKLDGISQNGLPACYKNVNEWLSDFYPYLPWDRGSIHSLIWLTTDPHAIEIITTFSKRVNFDMMSELEKALRMNKLYRRYSRLTHLVREED